MAPCFLLVFKPGWPEVKRETESMCFDHRGFFYSMYKDTTLRSFSFYLGISRGKRR